MAPPDMSDDVRMSYAYHGKEIITRTYRACQIINLELGYEHSQPTVTGMRTQVL